MKLFIVFCSLFKLCTCSNIFSAETFETCGVFLQDFELYTTEQRDFIHEVLEHLHLNQIRSQSVIIKTKASKRKIHPSIFRSMKYDCYLYVHINFGKKLLSTIPSIKNPLKSAYQKGLFIIFVKSTAREVLNIDNKSWKAQLARQFSIFVFKVKRSRPFNQNRAKRKFVLYKTYFFCAYCKRGLVPLNSTNTTKILSLKLVHFEKHWEKNLAQHYFQGETTYDIKLCSKQNVMHMYQMNPRCKLFQMIYHMIVFASGLNITMKGYASKAYKRSKLPQIFWNDQYKNVTVELFQYADPIVKEYIYVSIIYCYNTGRVAVAETKMWTKYVPIDVWGLLGLCLILSSVLFVSYSSDNISFNCVFKNFVLFVNSLFTLVRLLWRQSWSHKWKALGVIELLISFLLCIYENSITVSVVVPLVPKPLLNTMELFNNNYTFVVQQYNFHYIYNWLSDEYNTKNKPRVLGVRDFWTLSRWLEKYFLKQSDAKKYAIVGQLSKYFNFRAVTFVKEKNGTCYQMYPTEEAFYPQPIYITFASALSSSLSQGVSLLSALGFLRAFENAEEFRSSLIALGYTKPLMVKYNEEIFSTDLKNRREQESMITLGNLKSVLHVMLILIVSAGVSFVVEVCSIEIFLLLLPKRQRQQFQAT